MYRVACVEIRGQPSGVIPLFLPHEVLGWNSGHRAWREVPLPHYTYIFWFGERVFVFETGSLADLGFSN